MPIHYIVIQYPQQIVQMAFCDLSHTFHKQVTNISQHVFVILLWGVLTPPLMPSEVNVEFSVFLRDVNQLVHLSELGKYIYADYQLLSL